MYRSDTGGGDGEDHHLLPGWRGDVLPPSQGNTESRLHCPQQARIRVRPSSEVQPSKSDSNDHCIGNYHHLFRPRGVSRPNATSSSWIHLTRWEWPTLPHTALHCHVPPSLEKFQSRTAPFHHAVSGLKLSHRNCLRRLMQNSICLVGSKVSRRLSVHVVIKTRTGQRQRNDRAVLKFDPSHAMNIFVVQHCSLSLTPP